MFGDIFDVTTGLEALLASSAQRPGMLLNMLQCLNEGLSGQNVNSAGTEKLL